MTRFLPSRVLLIFSLLFSASSAMGAPQWSGPIGYEFVNQQTQVALKVDLINDSSKENATGTLEVQLWASDAPYESGTIRGVLCASAKLEGLSAGQYYKNLRRVVPYTPPAQKGTYNLVMLLLEYRKGAYVIVAHSNMQHTANLGPLPLFWMDAPWSFQTSTEGGTVDMKVAKINHRRTGNTGGLKLAVWVTAQPYHGGPLQGYEIGEVRKDPLKPGFNYSNVTNTAKLVKPPPGQYYVSLVLLEFNNGGFSVVAHLDDNRVYNF
jgi:hypothetical protein